MKVLAINASPHMDKGNTAIILNPFLEGMKEAGSEVDLFYTSKLRVEPCHGDLSYWLVLPGECAVKDDMQMRPWEWRKQQSLSSTLAPPCRYHEADAGDGGWQKARGGYFPGCKGDVPAKIIHDNRSRTALK